MSQHPDYPIEEDAVPGPAEFEDEVTESAVQHLAALEAEANGTHVFDNGAELKRLLESEAIDELDNETIDQTIARLREVMAKRSRNRNWTAEEILRREG